MKRSYVLSSFLVLGVMIVAGALSLRRAQAQGLAGSPEMRAKQLAIEKATPPLAITEDVLHLSIPGQTMGQTVGVSKNSKGHLFVYSRTGPSGMARGGTAAMLFEFDENNEFVKIWGPNNYAASFAHSVRVDKCDNVWSICVTPGSPQYLFSGDGTTGKIYKLDMDGKLLGWGQTSLGQGEDDAGRLDPPDPLRVRQRHLQGFRHPMAGREDHCIVEDGDGK